MLHRGWVIAVLAACVYGLLQLPDALVPQPLRGWFNLHPLFDGALFGPLLFFAVAGLTSWPLWVCLVLGITGVVLGTALGERRGRRMAAR